MQSSIEDAAELSVARGCGFGALAIATCMVGLSAEMPLAFQCGGILVLVMTLVLVLRGLAAPRMSYKRTEVWLMLEPDARPKATVAQQLIGRALREVYLRYALRSAAMAAVLLVGSVIMRLIGKPLT
jgi:hypothetical protein